MRQREEEQTMLTQDLSAPTEHYSLQRLSSETISLQNGTTITVSV